MTTSSFSRLPTLLPYRFVSVVALLAVLAAAGCKTKDYNAPGVTAAGVDPSDPATANMAQVAGGTGANGQPVQVLGQNEQGQYGAQGTAYPADQQYAADTTYEDQGNAQAYGNYEPTQAPPALPDYEQPAVARANSIWTPGYWAYNQRGYYWVPGAWVTAPYRGALWTPPYWQNVSGHYRFHPGYWGRHVGFYGGVAYGHGYPGRGFYGGYWQGPNFYYNRVATNVGPGIGFVYTHNAPTYGFAHASYNGVGGVALLPIAAEIFAMRERHLHPVRMQYESHYRAGIDPAQFWGGSGRLGIYAANGVYAPERYYAQPVVVQPGFVGREGWHEHHEERRGFVEAPRFAGAPEWGHGHFDNGWHGHKGEGERGEWHENGGGHGGEGHGEGHGGGHGHGHGHD